MRPPRSARCSTFSTLRHCSTMLQNTTERSASRSRSLIKAIFLFSKPSSTDHFIPGGHEQSMSTSSTVAAILSRPGSGTTCVSGNSDRILLVTSSGEVAVVNTNWALGGHATPMDGSGIFVPLKNTSASSSTTA